MRQNRRQKMLYQPKTTTSAILKIVKSAICKEVTFLPSSERICSSQVEDTTKSPIGCEEIYVLITIFFGGIPALKYSFLLGVEEPCFWGKPGL